MGQVVGGMAQGSPIIPVLFGALMVHKSKLTEAAVAEKAGAASEDRTLGLSYADDVTGIGAANEEVLQHRKQWKGKLAPKDDVFVSSQATHTEVISAFRACDMDPEATKIVCRDYSDFWTEPQRARARAGEADALPRGVIVLGMPIGNAEYVKAFVRRKATGDARLDEGAVGGAVEAVLRLQMMGKSTQARLLLLRHCLASKLSYLARFCPDELFAEVTDELQIAIDAELRTIADAPHEDFGGSKMRLARQTLRAGGTGVTRLSQAGAAVASMAAVASALARMQSALKGRSGMAWIRKLIGDTLVDLPRPPGDETPEDGGSEEAEEEAEDEAKEEEDDSEDTRAQRADEWSRRCELEAAQREARATRYALDLLQKQEAKEESDGIVGRGRTARMALLRGYAVAAKNRLLVAELPGPLRNLHHQLTAKVVRRKGEPRAEWREQEIPKSLPDLVAMAGKDKNGLQHRVNVHENALDWLEIYEASKENKPMQRRLEDLLLPGTSALYTAIPSSPDMRVSAHELAFSMRDRYGLESKMVGFYHMPADRLRNIMADKHDVDATAAKHRLWRHDNITDAICRAALESDLVVCRETSRYFVCHNGTGKLVTTDFMWINKQNFLCAGDVTFVGQKGSPAAKIHEKAYGYGTPYDRLRAVDRHIDEVRRIRQAEQDGTMGAREARKARFQAALRKDKAYHPGYVEPLKAKGVTYMQTVLTHYGGWHSGATGEDGFLNHVCHTGDGETHTGWGERFEHPTKTWACATHKQFTMQAVAVAVAKATWNWVRGKCEEAMREVLGAGRGVQAGEVETPAMAAEAGRETRRGAESDEESDGCNEAQDSARVHVRVRNTQ